MITEQIRKNDNAEQPAKPDKVWLTRINKYIVIAVLYAALCFANAYSTAAAFMTIGDYLRPLLGVLGVGAAEIPSGFWIHIFGGVVPLVVFELIVWLYSRTLRMNFPNVNIAEAKQILRIYYIPAVLIFGGARMLYFVYPLYMTLIEAVVPFVVTTVAFVLYYMYMRKRYFPKPFWGRALAVMANPYLMIVGAYAVVQFFMGVM
ncbi:MAG: hypothetical protein LBS99_05965 [Clostridiales bacterium]|jgi:hypothetical protein|nr:hypothetical protein [Clostridiales bacterium]